MSLLDIDVDVRDLLSALDVAGESIEAFTKPAARVTADAIAAEARSRVRRSAGPVKPWRSGHTADLIRVEETRDRAGYVVLANDPRTREHIDQWLEFGTKFMTPKPFFFAAAQLEADAHDRRMREAIQAGIDALGLGA